MSSSDRIPLEGVLNCWNDEHDLPDLLLFVCRTKKTGLLAFSNPEGDKTLHVRNGKIVFAESSSGDDGLGHYLLRTGKISLMDYLRVSKLVEPGKRLGALLVAEGVMEPKDLAPAVLGQVRAIILSLFRRTETWYRFKEESLSSETITLDLPVESLILDGVRQVESWRRISKGLGQLESKYRCVEEKQAEWEGASFPPVVEEIFEMLRKPTSVAEICTQATLPDFEACRYLWAFRSLGWVEPLEKPKKAEADLSASASADGDANVQPAARDIATLPNVGQAAPPAPPQPAGPPPRPKPDSKFRRPTIIPQQLIQTQVAIEPPKLKPDKSSTGNTQRVTPAPVIPDLEQTHLSVEPPSSPSPASPPKPPATPVDEKSQGKTKAEAEAEAAPPKPARIPANLAQTNLAIEPPSAPIAKAKDETPPSTQKPTPTPKPIPEALAHTNLAVEPPASLGTNDETKSTVSPAAAPPTPPRRAIPEELAHTNLAIEPPPTRAADEGEKTPVVSTASETKAEPAAEIDASPAPQPEPEAESTATSMADVAPGRLDQTQLFIDSPGGSDFEPGAEPPSTGEMMESILSGNSSPDVHARSESHASMVSDPDLETGQSRTEGARDDDEESRSPNPDTTATADGKEAPESVSQSEPEEAPAGFEALAFGDSDPSIGSIQNLSMPAHLSTPDFSDSETPPPRAGAGPEATPVVPEPETAPSVAAASSFEEEDAMASFQDLAYAPEPAAPAVPPPTPESENEVEAQPQPQAETEPQPEPEPEPVVEATIVSEPMPVFEAEPDGPAAEPPVLAPPPPPPRRRSADDDFDLDRDGFTHLITRNND